MSVVVLLTVQIFDIFKEVNQSIHHMLFPASNTVSHNCDVVVHLVLRLGYAGGESREPCPQRFPQPLQHEYYRHDESVGSGRGPQMNQFSPIKEAILCH